jgi:hypothetical protein
MSIIPILLIFSISIQSQTIKGLYVDGFFSILGNQDKEDSLLLFAQNNDFNYLTLYQVNQVNNNAPLNNFSSSVPFASFISKAKTQFGITQIGVAGENYNFFKNNIIPYNQQHSLQSEKVDVFNLEFEFWVPLSVEPTGVYCEDYLEDAGFACDTAGAFAYFKNMLFKIDSLANANGVVSETYFGWFNQGQGAQIVQTGVDRILLSVYVTSANYSSSWQYNYISSRLERLASAQQLVKIIPIYSAEPTFMQDWANNNPFFLPFSELQTRLATETASWKNHIQLEGIQWFAYTDLPKINLNLGISEESNKSISIINNQSENRLEIKSENELVKVQIAHALGNVIYDQKVHSTQHNIATQGLKIGLYYLNVQTRKGSFIYKFIIS